MREVKYAGEEALLTNKEHRELLSRFDAENIKDYFEGFTIRVSCCLCKKFSEGKGGCGKCPLTVFRKPLFTTPGCIVLIESVIGEPRAFGINSDEISWTLSNKHTAEKQVATIYVALKGLPKTNKRRRL